MTKDLCYDIITTEVVNGGAFYADISALSISINILPYVIKKQFIFQSSI